MESIQIGFCTEPGVAVMADLSRPVDDSLTLNNLT